MNALATAAAEERRLSDAAPAPLPAVPFHYVQTDSFVALPAELGASLLVSTYQAYKLLCPSRPAAAGILQGLDETVTPTGLEGIGVSPNSTTDLANSPQSSDAKSGAVGAEIDPELAVVVQAWSGLRDDARACILAIVRDAAKASDRE